MADDRLDGLLRAAMLEEILRLLTPQEALLAILRLQGRPDEEIAELLGMKRNTVTQRMILARKRIARKMPEAKCWLEGRQRRVGRAKTAGAKRKGDS